MLVLWPYKPPPKIHTRNLDMRARTHRNSDMETTEKSLTLQLDPLCEFELRQLAQFLKRVSFDACYRHTDGCADKDARNDQAYAMIAGLEAVRRALAEHGYCPR